MWVVVGPFDGDTTGEMGIKKPKLLKPNTSYTAGRKDRPLTINNKKVSHDHCSLTVGPHTAEDVANPTTRPILKFNNLNKKDKIMTLIRNEKSIEIAPSTAKSLKDGDVVTVISGVQITVKWNPVCAYSPTKDGFSVDACASLGVKLVHAPQALVTHHITNEYTADLSSSVSLLGICHFVKFQWLQDILGLAKSLEEHFVLPDEKKYRPSFSASLSSSQKNLAVWEPNEARMDLFQSCRFICLHEKITSKTSDLQEAIHRGKGTLENFDVHSGVTKFRRALARSISKGGKNTVIVGDAEAMELAVGKETWEEFVDVAQSSNLKIIQPSKIVEVVLTVDTSVLVENNGMEVDETSSQARVQSPVPEVTPASLSKEASVEPEASQASSRPRLARRVNSRAASREPSVAPSSASQVEKPTPLPRRVLTRRAITKPIITGIDDPSEIIDALPDLSSARITPPPAEAVDLAAPTPARTTKLKRRFGGTKEANGTSSMPMSAIQETVREPPLKKFKALFEASNQESQAEIESFDPLFESAAGPSSQTQTQTESQAQSGSGRPFTNMAASSLTVLREEEEETQAMLGLTGDSYSLTRGSKRRLDSEDDVEMQIADADERAAQDDAPAASKKRAVENVNAVERIPQPAAAPTRGASKAPATFVPTGDQNKNKDGAGAPPGKPDTDPSFLKAIASTKRGKKTEDAFDIEFNKLKITKPELEQQRDPEEEWGVLAEFGDDSGLRGNFMVVLEMDVYKKNDGGVLQQKAMNHSWDGKPNFKKFKKKVSGLHQKKVDLFISDDNEYGMTNAYWKGGQSQTQNKYPSDSQVESQAELDFPRARQTKGKSQAILDLDDSDDVPAPAPTRRSSSRKPPSRAGSAAPSTSRKATTSKSSKSALKANTLFLDSDEDIQEVHEHEVEDVSGFADMQDEEEETLKSSPEQTKPTGRRTKAAATTTAAKGKETSKSKKAAPIIVDDDSDDGVVFKGFKGKRGGR